MNDEPVVLVTGAARRVGAEIARMLHAAGCRVMLHYRVSDTEARRLTAELDAARPGTAATTQADLRDPGAPARVIQESFDRFGRLDALVNNASSFFSTPVGTIDEAAWDDLVGSNLKGPLFLSQAAAPLLRDALLPGGGCIVNITDIHARYPLKGYPLYSAAKAGLTGLTRALALELAPEVRVNAVAPGAIEWPENEADFPAAERKAIVARTLLGRTGEPADIARTVKFLVLDAPYITGQVIDVDGGRTVRT